MLSLNLYSSSNLNIIDDTKFKEKAPDMYTSNISEQSKSLFYLERNELERSISPDEIDNPPKVKGLSGKNIFEAMEHEINSLNSYTGKWPLTCVKPAQLPKNGLFFLQSEDKVQCAFCHVIVDDWNVNQEPLKEYIEKSPSCPFLLSSNYPTIQPRLAFTVGGSSQINSSTCNPRYPRMSDLKRRLMTYKDWPCIMTSSKQLAECGLFYAGPFEDMEDVVTCFYCKSLAESLANWDHNDNPWAEHILHFPDSGYLSLVRRHSGMQSQLATTNLLPMPQSAVTPQPTMHQHQSLPNLSTSLEDEIISEASNFFDKPLVLKVVAKHLKESSHHFSSFSELIKAIYKYNRELAPRRIPMDETGIWITKKPPKKTKKAPKKTLKFRRKQFQTMHQHQSGPTLSTSLEDEIISEASNIFNKPLVLKVVAQHLKESSHHFSSCRELVEAIYTYNKENAARHLEDEEDSEDWEEESSTTYEEEWQANTAKEAIHQHQSGPNLSTLEDEIISEASNFFDKPLVLKVVAKHLESSHHFSSFSELIKAIYKYNRELAPRVGSCDETGIWKTKKTSEILKIGRKQAQSRIKKSAKQKRSKK